ncbi:MAG: ATP-binding protein [Vulcanimicrobiota bacterium]
MGEKADYRIIVVDDEEPNIAFMKGFLNSIGYRTEGIMGGEKAVDLVVKNPPDLLITEIMTSGIDGFEVTRRLREEKSTRTLPIIIMTAQRSKSGRLQAFESGADEFITKPVDKNEVEKRINGLLERNFFRSLIDEKKKLDAIVEGMSDGIIILDPDFRLVRCNTAARRLLGLKKKLSGSSNLLDHLFGNFRISMRRTQIERGKKKEEPVRIVRPETDRLKALYISGKIARLRDPLGNMSSIVITVRDVTDMVKEELQKEAFLSSISHKLRTPATVLTGMLRLLNDETFGNLTDNQKNFLNKIHESAGTISQLIEKLIAFNTLTRKELMMEGEYITLAAFMPGFQKRVMQNYAHRKVQWKIADFIDMPPVYFNALQMEMIFWHLIDNAIKFNDKRHPQVKISTRLLRKQRVEITITDNGPGIPPENHELIFTQFYQYERIYTGNVEGLGLGLSMVKKILEDWGQHISLDSAIGRGSSFRFTLPSREVI